MDGLSDWLNRSGSQRKGSRGRLNSDEELGRCLEHGSKLPSSQTRWRRDSANGDPIYEKKVDATLSRSAVFWGRIKLGFPKRFLLLFITVILACTTCYLGLKTRLQETELKHLRFRLEGKALEFERSATRRFAQAQELTDKVAEAEAARESAQRALESTAGQVAQLQQKLQMAKDEMAQMDVKLKACSELNTLEERSKAVLAELSKLDLPVRRHKSQ